MTNEELIKVARESVEHAAQGAPDGQAARIRAGESDDDRLRLLVQLANALEETAREPLWEYGAGGQRSDGTVWCDDDEDLTSDKDEATAWVHEALDCGSFSNAVLVRRRAAGPWEPVGGEGGA